MILKQIETSNISNYFYDNGVLSLFKSLSSSIDDFEVESERLLNYCDELIVLFKGLKSVIKKEEEEEKKRMYKQEIADIKRIG